MSCLSNFYFFGGTDIGNIYVKRIICGNYLVVFLNRGFDKFIYLFISGNLQVNFILFLFCYSCAQVSIQVKLWEHRKVQNKKR